VIAVKDWIMFATIELARARVKEKAGIVATDATFDSDIDDLLNLSKGMVSGADEYRPYLVAAITMHTNKSEQTITEASGEAKFRFDGDRMNLRPAIEGCLKIQQSVDTSLGTDIPAGWDVTTWLDSLCGCDADNEISGISSSIFGVTVV